MCGYLGSRYAQCTVWLDGNVQCVLQGGALCHSTVTLVSRSQTTFSVFLRDGGNPQRKTEKSGLATRDYSYLATSNPFVWETVCDVKRHELL